MSKPQPQSPIARRAGLSPERIVDEATALSAEFGLDGWSIRDIAKRLDVVPSVIYHYFPDKEALCDAVVDVVLSTLQLPDPTLPWKEWFTALLQGVRPLLLEYHGITNRLVYGTFPKTSLPMIDTACQKLLDAGFGDRTAVAYSLIVNSAIHAIGSRELRSPKQAKDRHDLREMLDRLNPMAAESPGLRFMIDTYLQPLSQPDRENDMSEEYYRLMIASILNGVEYTLLAPPADETN